MVLYLFTLYKAEAIYYESLEQIKTREVTFLQIGGAVTVLSVFLIFQLNRRLQI